MSAPRQRRNAATAAAAPTTMRRRSREGGQAYRTPAAARPTRAAPRAMSQSGGAYMVFDSLERRARRDATNTARHTHTQEITMKWITREHPRVDRVACPWLVQRFVDKAAGEARRTGATPYDIKDVELGHHGPECSFDAFVHKYELDKDPAMAYMAEVIRGADTPDKTITPESVGVEALLDGIRLVHYPDDQAQRKA